MENTIYSAFIATMLTYVGTAAGAAMVFFFKRINLRVLNFMLGFASGVMVAAVFWSLLAPATIMAEEMSANGGPPANFVVASGFIVGAAFLFVLDRFMPHIHFSIKNNNAEGMSTRLRRSILLVLSITMHNIPEGLAVGVAFGAAGSGMGNMTLASAGVVALGIGLQNFPEGAAVSIPLRREGLSRAKCFFYGQLSGIVTPIAGVIGAALVVYMKTLLPYALAFAAGTMLYVVVEQLIPESQSGSHENTDLATMGCIAGFVVMMLLEMTIV